MSDADATAHCPSCGGPGVGGVDGCQAVFNRVLEREFSDPDFFRVHRMTVYSYCLQHPEVYMRSSKSAAAHLAGMCWMMERGLCPHLPKPLKAWVDGPRRYTRVQPPPAGVRGSITVVHIMAAVDPAGYERRVGEWAHSAWEAWSPHWEQARSWVQEALAGVAADAEPITAVDGPKAGRH